MFLEYEIVIIFMNNSQNNWKNEHFKIALFCGPTKFKYYLIEE